MKTALYSLSIFFGLGICALGFGSPDFSGNWIGDVTRTGSMSVIKHGVNGQMEIATKKLVVMLVQQRGEGLEIESVWSDNSATKLSYILDGNEHSSVDETGNPMIYQAKLNGDQLLIQATRNIKTPFGNTEIPTKEEWVLSADQNTLTITTTTTTQFGSNAQKKIYTRQ